MTFPLKDANQQPHSVATEPTVASEDAFVHVVAVDVGGVATLVNAARPLPVINTAGAMAIDGSGSITAGGQAQLLFGGAVPLNGYLVANNSASKITVCDVADASDGGASIPIAPGVVWSTPPGYKPAGPASIFGAVTGQQFAARKW